MIQDTKKDLIDVAYESFYTNGFHPSGLNSILDKSNVTKGALYHYFRSKKALMSSIIDEKLNKEFLNFWNEHLTEDQKPSKKIFTLMKRYIQYNPHAVEHGCFLSNMIVELSNDESFNIQLQSINNTFIDIIKSALDVAVLRGDLKSGTPTTTVAKMIVIHFHGMMLQLKNDHSIENYSDNIKTLKLYLQSHRN